MRRISRWKKRKMPKRILSISHYYVTNNRGGGEVMLHEILKRFVAEGYLVDAVAVDNDGNNETLDGVNVFKGRRYLNMLSKKYDLVVSQFQVANTVLKDAAKLNIPTMFIVHNNMFLTTEVLDEIKPSLVVFNTNWIRDFYNYQENNIVVHPPVYAKDHATTRGAKISLINLIPSKGVYVFYNMATQLPRLRFLGVRGGYYKNDQVILNKPNVQILENTKDMKNDVWGQTGILLMPSEYESYGMAAVEALASGIPVIAKPTPGLKESLGFAGIFPYDNTVGSWKREIVRLTNPVYYKQASDLALKRSAEIKPEVELDALIEKVKKII